MLTLEAYSNNMIESLISVLITLIGCINAKHMYICFITFFFKDYLNICYDNMFVKVAQSISEIKFPRTFVSRARCEFSLVIIRAHRLQA